MTVGQKVNQHNLQCDLCVRQTDIKFYCRIRPRAAISAFEFHLFHASLMRVDLVDPIQSRPPIQFVSSSMANRIQATLFSQQSYTNTLSFLWIHRSFQRSSSADPIKKSNNRMAIFWQHASKHKTSIGGRSFKYIRLWMDNLSVAAIATLKGFDLRLARNKRGALRGSLKCCCTRA